MILREVHGGTFANAGKTKRRPLQISMQGPAGLAT